MSLTTDLAALEALESRLEQLGVEREAADRRAAGDPLLEELEQARRRLEVESQQAAAQLRQLELEVEELRERASSHERAIYGGSVRHPAELERYQHEVHSLKALISQREEVELAGMEEQELREARLAEARREVADRAQELEAERARDRERGPALRAELEAASSERGRLEERLPPAALQLFRRVRQRRRPAVVGVVSGSCAGCRLPVSPRLIEEARHDRLVTCENCERILTL